MCNLQLAKNCASVETSLTTVHARAQEMGKILIIGPTGFIYIVVGRTDHISCLAMPFLSCRILKMNGIPTIYGPCYEEYPSSSSTYTKNIPLLRPLKISCLTNCQGVNPGMSTRFSVMLIGGVLVL